MTKNAALQEVSNFFRDLGTFQHLRAYKDAMRDCLRGFGEVDMCGYRDSIRVLNSGESL